MNEDTKTTPEILAQLDLIQEKLDQLRYLISPLLSTLIKEKLEKTQREGSSDVMRKINHIKDHIDSIIEDIDIN